jgi:hypothetical protein
MIEGNLSFLSVNRVSKMIAKKVGEQVTIVYKKLVAV